MGAQSVKLKVQSCLYRTSSGFVASRGCFREVSLATPTTSRKLWAGQRQNLSWFSIKSGDCQWERGDNATGRSIRSLGFKPTMSRSARSRYCRRHIVEGSFFCDLGGQWERGDNATGRSIRSLGFKPTMSRSARSRYCRRHIVEGSFFCDLGGQWERGDNATGRSIRSLGFSRR
jgi:hypothetical protein